MDPEAHEADPVSDASTTSPDRYYRFRRAVPLVLVTVGTMFGACERSTSEPVTIAQFDPALVRQSEDSVNPLFRLAPRMTDVNKCYSVVADTTTATTKYVLDSTKLDIDASTASTDGVTRFFHVRWMRPSGRTLEVVHCVLPKTPAARELARARFGTKEEAQSADDTSHTGSGAAADVGLAPEIAAEPAGADHLATNDLDQEPGAPRWEDDGAESARKGSEPTTVIAEVKIAPTEEANPGSFRTAFAAASMRGQQEMDCDYWSDMNAWICSGSTCLWSGMGGRWECDDGCYIIMEGEHWYVMYCDDGGGWGGGGAYEVIDIDCTPYPVQRGGTVTCTASSNQGSVTMTSWKFAPNGFEDTITRTTNVSSTQWAGVMAAEGMIVARGTVDGVTAYVPYFEIPVTNRSWTLQVDTFSIDSTKKLGNQASMECFAPLRHFQFTVVQGWVRVPNRCFPDVPTVLDPHPTSDTSGVSIVQVVGGPNNGLWYAAALQTKLNQKMQLLRDFRMDAIGFPVRTGDSVVVSCKAANVMDSAATMAMVTIGVVDSVCKSRVGFKNRVDSLWRHEHCHVRRAVFTVRDTVNTRRLDTLERVVKTAHDDVRNEAIRLLETISDAAMDSSLAIDQVQKPWPHYWGIHEIFPNPPAIDSIWTLRKDSLFAEIRPAVICP